MVFTGGAITRGHGTRLVGAHNTPAVLATVRDLIRDALKLAGHVNIASARRAHTDRHPAQQLAPSSLANSVQSLPLLLDM